MATVPKFFKVKGSDTIFSREGIAFRSPAEFIAAGGDPTFQTGISEVAEATMLPFREAKTLDGQRVPITIEQPSFDKDLPGVRGLALLPSGPAIGEPLPTRQGFPLPLSEDIARPQGPLPSTAPEGAIPAPATGLPFHGPFPAETVSKKTIVDFEDKEREIPRLSPTQPPTDQQAEDLQNQILQKVTAPPPVEVRPEVTTQITPAEEPSAIEQTFTALAEKLGKRSDALQEMIDKFLPEAFKDPMSVEEYTKLRGDITIPEGGAEINALAKSLGFTVEQLQEANPGVDLSDLKPGQVIMKPGGLSDLEAQSVVAQTRIDSLETEFERQNDLIDAQQMPLGIADRRKRILRDEFIRERDSLANAQEAITSQLKFKQDIVEKITEVNEKRFGRNMSAMNALINMSGQSEGSMIKVLGELVGIEEAKEKDKEIVERADGSVLLVNPRTGESQEIAPALATDPRATSDMKEYNFAVGQGFGGSFLDYLKLKSRSSGVTQTERDRLLETSAIQKSYQYLFRNSVPADFIGPLLPEQTRGLGPINVDEFLELRTLYVAQVGNADAFDDAFLSYLAPEDRAKLGLGKAAGFTAEGVPTGARPVIIEKDGFKITL